MPDYSPNNYHGSYYGSGSPETDHPPPQYAPPGQAPTGTRQQYPSPSGVPSYAPSSSPTYNKSQAIPGAHSSYTGPYPASPGPSRHTSHAESYQAFPGRPASSTGAYSASRSPHTSDTGPYPRRSALPSTFTPENSAYYSPRDVGLHADASQPTGYDHQWQSGPSLRDPPLRSRDPDYPRQEYGSPPDKKPVPARSDRPPADASNAIAVSKPVSELFL